MENLNFYTTKKRDEITTCSFCNEESKNMVIMDFCREQGTNDTIVVSGCDGCCDGIKQFLEKKRIYYKPICSDELIIIDGAGGISEGWKINTNDEKFYGVIKDRKITIKTKIERNGEIIYYDSDMLQEINKDVRIF